MSNDTLNDTSIDDLNTTSSVASNDGSKALIDSIQEHVAQAQPIRIVGGNSKSFLGSAQPFDSSADDGHSPKPSHSSGETEATLSLLDHHGVVNYEPTELVVTVRSGTPITTLVNTLKAAGQQLPFEPPEFTNATVGGTVACGCSGPARPYTGSVRDHMLGARIINGKGESLRFGGEVMKNVAGYDVSRVQVGAYGTLGVLLDVSLKVLPLPEKTLTLAFEQQAHDTTKMVQLARQFLPVTGVVLIGTSRFIRLAGSHAGVQAAAKQLGGEVSESTVLWQELRDLSHPFFKDQRTTWRLSVPDFSPKLNIPDDDDGTPADILYDWGGAQRWVKSNVSAAAIFNIALQAGGHATRFSTARDNAHDEPSHQPIEGISARLQKELRSSFDPKRLFNRGRFHPELDK